MLKSVELPCASYYGGVTGRSLGAHDPAWNQCDVPESDDVSRAALWDRRCFCWVNGGGCLFSMGWLLLWRFHGLAALHHARRPIHSRGRGECRHSEREALYAKTGNETSGEGRRGKTERQRQRDR